MLPYAFSCLQIGNTDLVGNKFNGYNLSFYLEEYGIKTNYLVVKKDSKAQNTFILPLKNGENYTEAIIKDRLFLDADIIHLNLIHCTRFDINMLPLLTSLKPTVITLHDAFFFGGHCLYSFECDKWKVFCNDCSKLDVPFSLDRDYSSYNFLMKKLAVYNSNIKVITASSYMEQMAKKSPIWKDKKVYKLPYGVDCNVFYPVNKADAKKNLGIDSNSTVIMFRANNGYFKGLEYIKEALHNLKTDKKITLLTVENKGLLKEFNNKFDIKEYGWIYEDAKLAKLYQASDLFLMPSKQEAFGMMAIEAMASKAPVLSIKGTSLEDVTGSPACSLSVEPPEFTATLQYLIDNPDIMELRGEKSLEYVKRNYDKDICTPKMIEIYREIIEDHKKNQTKEAKLTLEQLKKHAGKSRAVLNIEKPPVNKKSILFSRKKQGDKITTTILGIKIKTKVKK